jgi:hypothetical protein
MTDSKSTLQGEETAPVGVPLSAVPIAEQNETPIVEGTRLEHDIDGPSDLLERPAGSKLNDPEEEAFTEAGIEALQKRHDGKNSRVTFVGALPPDDPIFNEEWGVILLPSGRWKPPRD